MQALYNSKTKLAFLTILFISAHAEAAIDWPFCIDDSCSIKHYPNEYRFVQDENIYNDALKAYKKIINQSHTTAIKDIVVPKKWRENITLKKEKSGNVSITLTWNHLDNHTPGQFWREEYSNHYTGYNIPDKMINKYSLTYDDANHDYYSNSSRIDAWNFMSMKGMNREYLNKTLVLTYNTYVAQLERMDSQAYRIMKSLIRYEKKSKTIIGDKQLSDFVPTVFPKMIYPVFKKAKTGFIIQRNQYGRHFLTVTLSESDCQLGNKYIEKDYCTANDQVSYNFELERLRIESET